MARRASDQDPMHGITASAVSRSIGIPPVEVSIAAGKPFGQTPRDIARLSLYGLVLCVVVAVFVCISGEFRCVL